MRLILDKEHNIVKIATSDDTKDAIEVEDEIFTNKEPTDYRVVVTKDSVMVTPKSDIAERKKERAKTKISEAKGKGSIQDRLNAIEEFLGLS